MKAFVITLLMALPLFAVGQTRTDAPCEEAKAFENQTCILTIERIYTAATVDEEYNVVALFSEPTEVRVKSVACTNEGIRVSVTCAQGNVGFFYAATLADLHTVLRLAKPADLGVITF